MRLFNVVFAVVSLLLASGCSTMDVEQLKVSGARPDTRDLTIVVDKTAFNEGGEAVAIENGLKRKFTNSGYRLIGNGLELRARIVKLTRGNTTANYFFGMLAGTDVVELKVELFGQSREQLMSFNVKSEILDKRYADLQSALTEDIPLKVVEQVNSWVSAK